MRKDSGRVELHTPAPDFCLTDFRGGRVCLSDHRGHWHTVVIFNRGFL